jgi:hypothetical protein
MNDHTRENREDFRKIFDKPPPEPGRTEIILRGNLREKATELKALLERANARSGYEDGFCEFYAQSFKVFAIQEMTVAIVEMLESLLPGEELSPFFRKVLTEGTRKTFKHDDNERWVESAGPILTAFLHARFFLGMACEYTDPPHGWILPKGWMALRTLYGIR